MPESPSNHQMRIPPERSGRWRRAAGDDPARDALAQAIPRRAQVSWWLALVLAFGFAAIVTPAITAERWLWRFQPGSVVEKQPAPFTVRAPMLAGYDQLLVGGGVVVARGELATHDEATVADAIARAMPRGPALYLALFALSFALAAIFSHHMRRSTKGRLVRVQLVSLAVIALLAIVAKALMLVTALSALVVPVAVLAIIPTMVLDRVVGIATGVLAALVVSLLAPFDVGLAILLLVQAATAGLVVAERPKHRWTPALSAGLVTTLCTGAMYLLLAYLTTGHAPAFGDPLHAAWLAAVIGPALAAFIAVPLIPLYQLLVGEITQSRLIALEDLSHPLLRQIAERSPGTWQHSLMMANMAEIAANAIGASGRLVRVGAYFHDLGKSLSPKYFIENLEAGETSPHDQLPPEVSCDAIFAHVSEGLVAARKAGLHERIIDFMHMHHGNGVLEYFWAKCREQGNPHGYSLEQFRYPGHPPQSRETAILTICDAVEAASRTLKKPDAVAIDSLVQRIVYGKLHLGQLDESGLSMSDLRRISDSLRETIRHANHGRIEYPWQKADQDASASAPGMTSTAPRLDSLDRKPARDSGSRPVRTPAAEDSNDALAATADVQARPLESDAARVRPGTARNAHGATPSGSGAEAPGTREATPSGHGANERAPRTRDADTVAFGRGTGAAGQVVDDASDEDTGRREPRSVPVSERTIGSHRALHSDRTIGSERAPHSERAPGDRDALATIDTARAAAPPRDPAATLPGRAPGPSPDSAGVRRRSDGLVRPDEDDPHQAITLVRDDAENVPTKLFLDDERVEARLVASQGAGAASAHAARDHGAARASGGAAAANSGATAANGGATSANSGATSANGGATAATGGAATANSGATSTNSGATSANGGATAATGGATSANGGATAANGGAATATSANGGATAANGGATSANGGATSANGGATSANSGATSANSGATSANGGATSANSGATSANGGATSANDGDASVNGGADRVRAATQSGGGEAPIAAVRDRAASVVEPLPVGELSPAVRKRAATLPPAHKRRPTTAPPPVVAKRVEPSRSAGPPEPVDLENATTNPPPLRRTPSGQPAVPQDPAQIAAALAAIVSRVSAAPFGRADRASEDAEAAVTQPSLAAATDHAVTVPSMPAEPRPGSATAHPKPSRRATTANPAPPAHLPGPVADDARVTQPRTAAALDEAARITATHGAGDRTAAAARITAAHDDGAADRLAASLDSKLDPLPDAAPSSRDSGIGGGFESIGGGFESIGDALGGSLDGSIDAGVTEPSMPVLDIGDQRRIDVPVRSVARTVPSSSPPHRKAKWSSGLAARIDAVIESDEWGHETPVVAPSKAELRALTGHPDPTRQVPVDELEILQRRAAELASVETPRRVPHPTSEVDPDDIEAAIELAPPARRPIHANAIGPKPKKSE